MAIVLFFLIHWQLSVLFQSFFLHRYAAHHGLGWEQRFIGSTYDPNPFEAAFGVWFGPAAFLIGPDGRILAKDLEGEAIKRAVAKVLSSEP